MINSANTVDFGLSNSDSVEILPGESVVVPSQRRNEPAIYASRIPQNNARVFANYGAPPLIHYAAYSADTGRVVKYISNTKDIVQSQENNNNNQNNKDRVRVQHLQTHEKLQNNRWNYHTLYNLSPEMEREIPNNNNNKIQNESAFIECNKSEDPASRNSSGSTESNFNYNSNKTPATRVMTPILFTADSAIAAGVGGAPEGRIVSSIYRTEDQENAFRRIEDVHNYAKLKRYSYSNGSEDEGIREDEDDDDEDDEDDEEEPDDELDDENVGSVKHQLSDDLDTSYESFYNNLQSQHVVTKVKTHVGKETLTPIYGTAIEKTDTDAHVDVETVQQEPGEFSIEIPIVVTPEHHARRPMNAFLIFCKRHRAIVKDRYKSLENRAITKILGDWWASLDINDKKCFTNLAQLNKDAFFSANPNFKWCKLPAPPLRTLNTRPSNAMAERSHDQEPSEEEDYHTTSATPTTLQVLRNSDKSGNYFKFADEAQMGDLSALLMGSGAKHKKIIATQPPNSALQQALGETTQFLSTHMPPLVVLDSTADAETSQRLEAKNTLTAKRRLPSDNGGNSFSSNSNSNSGEDDIVPPKKSARSCKGKIYQELINSGQIAAIAKKSSTLSKSARNAAAAQSGLPSVAAQQSDLLLDLMRRQETAVTATVAHRHAMGSAVGITRSASESLEDLVGFDLEERIKGLPALSLDAYLQRKRNTKKKKKFTAKKRNANSASTGSSKCGANATVNTTINNTAATVTSVGRSPTLTSPPKETCREPPAVGSQKRKARKESITRRDISAIENEVAAALLSVTDFTTINGCYFFNETPVATPSVPVSTTTVTTNVGRASPTVAAPSYDRRISSVALNNFSENISSTSDLLILAEVAANRTELTN